MKYSKHSRVHITEQIQPHHELILEGDAAHHIKNVLRKNTQSSIRVFNQMNGEYLAKINEIRKNNISLIIEKKIRTYQLENPLILGICIIKPDKMVEAIKGAVQIGVTEIYPLISERVQHTNINIARYNRCIIESVQQSERLFIPKLHDIQSLQSFLENKNIEQIIFANENEDQKFINTISNFKQNTGYLVGAEGGFSNNEKSFITSWQHVHSVTLGSNVLRSEIATIVGLGIIQNCKQTK